MIKTLLVRRAAKTAAAVSVALGASLGSIDAASAAGVGDHACHRSSGAAVCILVSTDDSVFYNVHAGIDVPMSQADAQAILDQPGNAFDAYLVADDEWFDTVIAPVHLTGESAWAGGISADFDEWYHWSVLDEDWGTDELYVRIRLYDQRAGTRTFYSPVVSHDM